MGLLKMLFGLQAPAQDDREDFLLDENGRPLSIRIEGPLIETDNGEVADLLNHEQVSHDGTPHQNPAVYYETRGWLFPRRVQVSYYPLTISEDGRVANVAEMQARADAMRKQNGQRMEVAAMPGKAVKQAIRVEDAGQRAKGVKRLRRPFWGKR